MRADSVFCGQFFLPFAKPKTVTEMFITSTRSLTFLTKLKSRISGASPDISRNLASENLPKVTGNGPFAELPQFESLGDQGALLNVTMPASSRLSIRSGSIVGMNGNLSHLSSSIKNLSNVKPLLYQELTSISPISVLLSGGPNYTVLDLKGRESWLISQSQSIVAWTGYNLQLISKPRSLSGAYKLDNYTRVRTQGNGKVVLGAASDILQIKLDQGEEIIIDPSSLIAHKYEGEGITSASENIEFTTIQKNIFGKLPSIQLPQSGYYKPILLKLKSSYVKVSNWVNYLYVKLGGTPSYAKKASTNKLGLKSSTSLEWVKSLNHFWQGFKSFLSSQLTRFKKEDIYCKIQGPTEILIQSNVKKTRRVLTKQELDSIYETLK